ncbi:MULTISPECIES: tetratricopeptide repeat protein [Nostoc]|uniref:tetratricopeptide repeat protein n=1 Tax=Nostoc TaxID=1177 RepID=UPI001F54FA6F|nr:MULTISPECIES: tetratricopeptide repeat protein [Nostoc]
MQRGNYQEGIENFNQAIELEKDFAVAYSDRCLAYLQLQDYHQGVTDCTQAINFAPDNFEPGFGAFCLARYPSCDARL